MVHLVSGQSDILSRNMPQSFSYQRRIGKDKFWNAFNSLHMLHMDPMSYVIKNGVCCCKECLKPEKNNKSWCFDLVFGGQGTWNVTHICLFVKGWCCTCSETGLFDMARVFDIVEAHCYVEYKVGLVNFRAEM